MECGFCCDGTLFLHAHLNPGERGHLPEKIERASYSKDGRDYFRLPCGYFDRKCTIYDQKKANVCSDYRCQLLKDFSAGKISHEDALQVVREAGRMRAELFEEWKKMTGEKDGINFMSILREMEKIRKATTGGEAALPQADMIVPEAELVVPETNMFVPQTDLFVARCNIFEALLIKHFWSAGEFDKLMMPGK